MPNWIIFCVLAVWAVLGVLLVTNAVLRTAQRRRVSGEVVAVRHLAGGGTPIPVRVLIVEVRAADGRLVKLVNPPWRDIAVGDRVADGDVDPSPWPDPTPEPTGPAH